VNSSSQVYQAGLIDPGSNNEALAGELRLDRCAAHFQAGSVTVEIPVDHLTARLDDAGENIWFEDSTRPGRLIYTADLAVLGCHWLPQLDACRAECQAAANRRELSRRLRVTAGFVLGGILLTWIAMIVVGVMARSLAASVPAAWEKKAGEDELRELQARFPFVDDSNLVSQLEALAAPLEAVTPGGVGAFQFHVVDLPIANAFALPGGHIVVTTELLRAVDHPEELLGVLAHEMSHVTQRHHARKIISSAGPLVICKIFLHSGNGVLNVLSQGSGLLVNQSFSQDYETEADDTGWKYLVAAHIDPRGMIDMFRKFEAIGAEKDGGVLQAFASHPALEKRIDRLTAKWERLPVKSGFLVLTNPLPEFKGERREISLPKLLHK